MLNNRRNKYFVAIDPGAFDMTTVAFQWGKSGDAIPSAFTRTSCRGFRNGVVINLKDAITSVSGAMASIKEKIGSNVQDVYCTISAAGIRVSPSEGTLLLSKYGREIFERDIKKCVEIARAVKISLDREVLHSVITSFKVDDEESIMSPRRLEGVKLKANINNITINSSVIKNISKCISQAGYIPSGFVFSGLAASFRALDEQDKKSGVLLMNVCSELIETVIFFEGILVDCKVFQTGTNEVVVEDGIVEEALIKDILEKLRLMSGWNRVKKIVMIGDAVLNDNFIEQVEQYFPVPIKAGKCLSKHFEHLPPDKTGYIGSLGIVDYLQEKRHLKKRSSGWRLFAEHVSGFVDKYF